MADSNQARALRMLRNLKDEFREGARLYQSPGLYHVLVQLAYESRQTESGYVEHPKLHRIPPVLKCAPRIRPLDLLYVCGNLCL